MNLLTKLFKSELFKTVAFAGFIIAVGAVAAYAQETIGFATPRGARDSVGDPCVLIRGLQGVFRTLRTLAFAGAAFVMMAWAWQFISKGWTSKDGASLEDAKGKGTGLLIGFAILFALGLIMQFLPGIVADSQCQTELTTGW